MKVYVLDTGYLETDKNIHTLEQSSYALITRVAVLQYGTFLHIGTYIRNFGLVIYFHVPNEML